MSSMIAHIKRRIFLGFLASIPFALSYFAIRLLYVSIDQRITGFIERTLGIGFPGMGLLVAVASLYLLGVLASNLVGRRILGAAEQALTRIPLIKTTYNIGKQLSDTLSLPEKQVFKRVVLIEFLKPGMWTAGFVTGHLTEAATGEKLLKVYVPTPPNPLSGTIIIARESDVRDPGWTVEEALNLIVSAGIIGPNRIR